MSFRNRTDAGRKLAKALAAYKDEHPVILGLPRGGVPVAAEVAAALNAPLDLILVRKIGAPIQPELAMGAVVDGGAPIMVRNAEMNGGASADWASRTRRRCRPNVIVIYDGVATGATTRAALRATRMRSPKKLILAVPLAPTDKLAALREDAD